MLGKEEEEELKFCQARTSTPRDTYRKQEALKVRVSPETET